MKATITIYSKNYNTLNSIVEKVTDGFEDTEVTINSGFVELSDGVERAYRSIDIESNDIERLKRAANIKNYNGKRRTLIDIVVQD